MKTVASLRPRYTNRKFSLGSQYPEMSQLVNAVWRQKLSRNPQAIRQVAFNCDCIVTDFIYRVETDDRTIIFRFSQIAFFRDEQFRNWFIFYVGSEYLR